jgi:hypothetical protein
VVSKWTSARTVEGDSRSHPTPLFNGPVLAPAADLGGDVGLVTFMLDGLSTADGRPLPLQRRTLLFVRERGAWKLAHLHASAASQP